jgi:hypothetical protein
MAENAERKPAQPKLVKIKIDRAHYEVPKGVMTGAELRTVPDPDVPADRDLWEERPGDRDRKVDVADTVDVHEGMKFFTAPNTINPGAGN